MLTLDSILKTTRQMASFGERGTAGALDHLPERVQGRRGKKPGKNAKAKAPDAKPMHRWDEELQIFVRS